jgi:hypothetical protein
VEYAFVHGFFCYHAFPLAFGHILLTYLAKSRPPANPGWCARSMMHRSFYFRLLAIIIRVPKKRVPDLMGSYPHVISRFICSSLASSLCC